jgi:hypothetical protein
MSRLASAFNLNDSIRTKEFELGGFNFKVRVPLDRELEEITKRFVSPPEELVKPRMEKVKAILESEETEINEESVLSILRMEQKITEYFRLLIPANGEPDALKDVTYDEITEEFPLQLQLELLTKITEAIQPGYKDARKN